MTDNADHLKFTKCMEEGMIKNLHLEDDTTSGRIEQPLPVPRRPSHTRRDSKCKVHKMIDIDTTDTGIDQEKAKQDRWAEQLALARSATMSPTPSSPASSTRVPSTPTALISKDALSEMVLSVRDLSNNLSNITMKLNIKTVMIVSKITDPAIIPLTREVALWLLGFQPACNSASASSSPAGPCLNASTQGPLHVAVQDVVGQSEEFGYQRMIDSGHPGIDRLRFWNQNMCSKQSNSYDFVVTLGGDGTVLFTSWLFQTTVPPVLSIGLGSLGFMTEYMWDRKEEILTDCLQNGISCSLRMRFCCTIFRSKEPNGVETHKHREPDFLRKELESADDVKILQTHTPTEKFCILNEVVVDRGPNPVITTTELFGDYNFITTMQADGVVISTPSGSTAYSLSAGGSLIHPDIPGILVSPICAHTLSFRPIVLPDSMVVRVAVPYDARTSAWCAFDGKKRVELNRGDFLTVMASRYPFPKVNNGQNSTSWFNRLTSTLHWNERERQKSY